MLELMLQVNLQIPDIENCSNKPVLLHLENKKKLVIVLLVYNSLLYIDKYSGPNQVVGLPVALCGPFTHQRS